MPDLGDGTTDMQTESSSSTGGSSTVTPSSSSGSETETSTTMETTGSESTESSESSESSSSSSTTTTGVPACGDGVLDEGEACDDGNDEDADACTNACVAGFYTGSLDPCSEYGQTMCGYFEAECRVDPNAGEFRSLCYWPDATAQETCDATPGIWTPSDGAFALDSGFDFPEGGACITQLLNLRCTAADESQCADAGAALCFREKAVGGGELDVSSICWWDVDEVGCDQVPGIWTEPDSGFGEAHPNSLPAGQAACILQVNAL